jgi:DNA-binding transcriptional regulator YdaS (Cro superfamily)
MFTNISENNSGPLTSDNYTVDFLKRIQQAAGGQSALAELLSISHAAVWKWEQHREIPLHSLPAVVVVAHRLGVHVEPARLRPDFFTDEIIAAL